MEKKLITISSIAVALLGISTSISSTAHAATAYTTPSAPYRYKTKSAYYYDLSTSSHYKEVWNRAINGWKSKGFNWKKAANSSKTTLGSYNGTNDMNRAGFDKISYNPSTGQITKSDVRLNRAVFSKYGYSLNDQVNVAEHELGHALGLNHNNPGSVSVMNPANRYYSIQPCDVRGMNHRYSTTALFDSVPGADNIITIIQYTNIKPELRKVSTHYNSKAKSLHISGLATQGNRVVVKYGTEKLATTNINAKHEFDAKVKFTGYKTISLYAVNKANKRVTPIVKLTANRYAAPSPTVEKSHRTSKAINYDLTTAKNKGTLVFYYQRKKFYSQKVKSTKTRISFTQDQLKGKKGNFTVRYFQTGKKASPAVKAPIVKVGSVTQIFY